MMEDSKGTLKDELNSAMTGAMGEVTWQGVGAKDDFTGRNDFGDGSDVIVSAREGDITGGEMTGKGDAGIPLAITYDVDEGSANMASAVDSKMKG